MTFIQDTKLQLLYLFPLQLIDFLIELRQYIKALIILIKQLLAQVFENLWKANVVTTFKQLLQQKHLKIV